METIHKMLSENSEVGYIAKEETGDVDVRVAMLKFKDNSNRDKTPYHERVYVVHPYGKDGLRVGPGWGISDAHLDAFAYSRGFEDFDDYAANGYFGQEFIGFLFHFHEFDK